MLLFAWRCATYNTSARDVIGNVYVKNLNAENEGMLEAAALVKSNMTLFTGVCKALIAAARELGIAVELNLWVTSHHKNPKILRVSLHEAIRSGGSRKVQTANHWPILCFENNEGSHSLRLRKHLHLAPLEI